MEIIKELEAMRKRMVQEINTEFDLLIERAISEGLTVDSPPSPEPYESLYSLTAGSKIFKGTKPTSVIFEDNSCALVSTWKQVVSVIMDRCLKNESNRRRLTELCGKISGRKRSLLARTGGDMRSPMKLCDDLFMETHYDTETLLNVLTNRILGAIGYDYSDIKITIRNR